MCIFAVLYKILNLLEPNYLKIEILYERTEKRDKIYSGSQ